MKINFILTLVSFLTFQTLLGQIEIDKPIIFTSSTEIDRIVDGISTTSNTDLLNAKEVIINSYQYAKTIISSDTIFADFSIDYKNLNIGLKLYIKLPTSITSDINYLQIDNIDAQRIYINIEKQFTQENSIENETLMIIYDGTSFQVLKEKILSKECMSGFVNVGDNYCVSQFRQGPGNFHENSTYCNGINARLCSWSEWYYACETNVIITDMLSAGHEWVDSGGTGAENAKIMGNTKCSAHSFANNTSGSAFFRCCYSFK